MDKTGYAYWKRKQKDKNERQFTNWTKDLYWIEYEFIVILFWAYLNAKS